MIDKPKDTIRLEEFWAGVDIEKMIGVSGSGEGLYANKTVIELMDKEGKRFARVRVNLGKTLKNVTIKCRKCDGSNLEGLECMDCKLYAETLRKAEAIEKACRLPSISDKVLLCKCPWCRQKMPNYKISTGEDKMEKLPICVRCGVRKDNCFKCNCADYRYEIGSQWRTRGGWRAVVVDILEDGVMVCHLKDNEVRTHYSLRGRYDIQVDTGYDLLDPWVEKKIGHAYVNVYDGYIPGTHDDRNAADKHSGPSRLARIKIEWTEGQFDE